LGLKKIYLKECGQLKISSWGIYELLLLGLMCL
jgi:hypothetical protein